MRPSTCENMRKEREREWGSKKKKLYMNEENESGACSTHSLPKINYRSWHHTAANERERETARKSEKLKLKQKFTRWHRNFWHSMAFYSVSWLFLHFSALFNICNNSWLSLGVLRCAAKIAFFAVDGLKWDPCNKLFVVVFSFFSSLLCEISSSAFQFIL